VLLQQPGSDYKCDCSTILRSNEATNTIETSIWQSAQWHSNAPPCNQNFFTSRVIKTKTHTICSLLLNNSMLIVINEPKPIPKGPPYRVLPLETPLSQKHNPTYGSMERSSVASSTQPYDTPLPFHHIRDTYSRNWNGLQTMQIMFIGRSLCPCYYCSTRRTNDSLYYSSMINYPCEHPQCTPTMAPPSAPHVNGSQKTNGTSLNVPTLNALPCSKPCTGTSSMRHRNYNSIPASSQYFGWAWSPFKQTHHIWTSSLMLSPQANNPSNSRHV